MARNHTKTNDLRLDSAGIMRALGGLRNSNTGLGSSRDKSASVAIAPTERLSVEECQSLCRDNGLLNNVVECYPSEAAKSWFLLTSDTADVSDLFVYMSLGQKATRLINDDCRNLKDYFERASILARRFGDCYLLLGIADGQDTDKPVDFNRIDAFVGVSLSRQVTRKEDLYEVNGVLWHPDRILRFCGVPLYDQDGKLEPNSDSVLQNIFTAFSRWEMGNVASAAMLADYNFLTIGIKGLGQALRTDNFSGTQGGIQGLFSRLLSIDMNRSISRSIAHDLDNEKIEMISRTWGGAKDILESLKDALSSATNIPRWRMFNDQTGGGLSNSVNTVHIAQSDWKDRVKSYKETQWRSHLEYILEICTNAKDAPVIGDKLKIAVVFPTGSYISDVEQIQIEKEAAERSKILIDSGIISPDEARNCYRGSEFISLITLTETTAPGIPQQIP
jgi:phage-related protein (TIGR01555 family)